MKYSQKTNRQSFEILKFCLSVIFIFISFAGYTQIKKENTNNIWTEIGAYKTDHNTNYMASINFRSSKKSNYFRFAKTKKFVIFGTKEKINELGLMMGNSIAVFNTTSINFYGGIGGVYGNIKGGYASNEGGWIRSKINKKANYYSPCIPLNLSFCNSTDNLGVGVDLFANINPERSYVGLMLKFQMGKLR